METATRDQNRVVGRRWYWQHWHAAVHQGVASVCQCVVSVSVWRLSGCGVCQCVVCRCVAAMCGVCLSSVWCQCVACQCVASVSVWHLSVSVWRLSVCGVYLSVCVVCQCVASVSVWCLSVCGVCQCAVSVCQRGISIVGFLPPSQLYGVYFGDVNLGNRGSLGLGSLKKWWMLYVICSKNIFKTCYKKLQPLIQNYMRQKCSESAWDWRIVLYKSDHHHHHHHLVYWNISSRVLNCIFVCFTHW